MTMHADTWAVRPAAHDAVTVDETEDAVECAPEAWWWFHVGFGLEGLRSDM